MQSMTMTLSRRCMYAKLHVIWSKSLLYIFSLINHIDSLELNMYYVFLFADVSDFCWLQNKSTMSFCSCLLIDELMLSSSHRFISISNVDFLNSIVDVLNSDVELLLLLSFALMSAKWEKEKRMKRLFIFLFIEIFSEFWASSF